MFGFGKASISLKRYQLGCPGIHSDGVIEDAVSRSK